MGRIMELFSETVRLSKNTTWMAAHVPAAMRVGNYLLRARAQAVALFPPSDPRHGIIYGPAEHDTCSMGMGNAAKVVDDQYMLYYFSVSMQSWRGMVELGALMQDYPAAAGTGANATLATQLLQEAVLFKRDIDAAVARSVVRNATSNAIVFVPAAVTVGANNATPYTDMTSDTLKSYSNFRYESS